MRGQLHSVEGRKEANYRQVKIVQFDSDQNLKSHPNHAKQARAENQITR